jgi:hypothetical protein
VKQIFHRRLLGAIAGGTAAYALVFNLFLLGILTAPSAYADLDGVHVLCITSPGTPSPDGPGSNGSGSGSQTHCPICLGRGPVGGLPPQMAVHFERLAIRVSLAVAPVAPAMPSASISAHRARGPPLTI